MRLFQSIKRLKGRRAQLGLLSGLVLVCLCATAFLATQVIYKLDDYASASQDNIPWSLSRLEAEQLKLLSAIDNLDPENADSLHLLNRRFDALFSRSKTIGIGPVYEPLLENPKAEFAYGKLKNNIEQMQQIMDAPRSILVSRLDELEHLTREISTPVQRLQALGIGVDSSREKLERNLLITKLLQATGLSILLVLALISLTVVLWRLYRLYRQRAIDNRQTLNRLATILDTSQDAALVVCPDGCIIDTNRAADAMFFGGKAPEDRPPVSDVLLRKQEDETLSPVSGQMLLASCAAGPNLCSNLIARDVHGSTFPVEISADRAMRSGHEVVICFLRNITRRLADQAELVAAHERALSGEQAKARFLGMVSHEMRTPLTGMLGALDLLSDTDLTNQQKDYAQIMLSSGQLLLHQINDALDLAQAEEGKLNFSEVVFDLDKMLETLLAGQEAKALENGNRISLRVSPQPLGYVRGDHNRVHQVLLNLVANANKFTRNGEITIEVARDRGENGHGEVIEFQVSDTGVGIAEQDHSRIFDDFVRLDNRGELMTEGTGLGLGIALSLVKLMNGEIGLESEPGEGSLFWVRLPLPSEKSPEISEDGHDEGGLALTAIPAAPTNILIAEDNDINRRVLAEMLEKSGHHVTQACNGAEVLDHLAAKPCFDLILMDINMPVLDGIATTRRIRAMPPPAAANRIFALTAHVTPDLRKTFLDAGMDGVLTKPLDRNALNRAIQKSGYDAQIVPDTAQLIDQDVLKQLESNVSEKALQTLQDGFVDQGTALMATLDPSLPELQAQLHELAGLAATVGARPLHSALARAESALKSGNVPDVEEALSKLPQIWMNTLSELRGNRKAA